jgi:predicted DNA-binding ribbon-helix-helix protein
MLRTPKTVGRKIARLGIPVRYFQKTRGERQNQAFRLEDEFWDALGEIAAGRAMSRPALCREIAKRDRDHNYSSTVRVFVLEHYRERCRKAANLVLLAPNTSVEPSVR